MSSPDHGKSDDSLHKLSETSGGLPLRRMGSVVPVRPSAFRPLLRSPKDDEEQEEQQQLPLRYEIREADDRRALRCKEAPGIGVDISRQHAFSETEARKLGDRIILIDGAGQFSPTLDDSKHLYNLDHHSGCLRAFTLATCEQALILVLKGLELDKGDWTIYANEPDLDTVFAIWVLLNYRRVRHLGVEARDAIVPLLRLEGAIDANGFEIAEFCGLPQARLVEEKERLDRLHQHELDTKKKGEWSSIDLAEYTLDMLTEIDKLVYKSTDFQDFTSVEQEYGHVDIGQNRVAVICRDSAGIYEVEKRLKKVWGERLGIIALERTANQYTLRRTAAFSGIDLGEAYGRLNFLDPAVDGRPPEKRWGGSDDIGGSPRPVGTGLIPREVGKILKLTYQTPKRWSRFYRLVTTSLWAMVLTLAGGVAVFAWRQWGKTEAPIPAPMLELGVFALVVAMGAWGLTRSLSRGWMWLFGWRLPAGGDWLYLVLPALLGTLLGGAWLPREATLELAVLPPLLACLLLTCLALGLAFPGMVHGLLILEHRVQTVGGNWFVSSPAVTVGALYALVTLVASRALIAGPAIQFAEPWSWLTCAAGSFLTGTSLAMIRERSLSLWPAALTLLVGSFLALLLAGIVPVLG